MKKIHQILTLIAMGGTLAHAGERETFDFGWMFKYFGPEDPAAAGSPATATASQPAHPAWHAVDGNPSTRWCAPNNLQGYELTVETGIAEPIKKIDILWEKACQLTAEVEYVADGKKVSLKIAANGKKKTSIEVKDKHVSSFKMVIMGTSRSAWASVREISFVGEDGKVIPLKRQTESITPASPHYNDKDEMLPATASAFSTKLLNAGHQLKNPGFRAVQLPHDWAIESEFLADEPNETGKLPWNGYGWYRKHFSVPASFDASKERWYLDFDGVMSCPKVYINGKLAGEWAFGYNSFRVDITPFLEAGKQNLVAVQASNLPLSTRWYPGAGIYRHVWLEKCEPVHLGHWGVFVTTPVIEEDKAIVRVQTTVDNTGKTPVEVTVENAVGGCEAEPATVSIKPGKSQVVTQDIVLPSPQLWDCENPNLYQVDTRVVQNGKEIDTKETTFGVRSIDWRKDGFYLNGKKVPLKGVCEHHDLGALGSAFHTRAYERKIEILKEMGCNSIRMTHNPPAPEVLDLCDKHGILVIDELFDIWKNQKYDKVNGYHKYWPQWWRKDVRNFVMRDRNHPSIIAWCGGNEIPEIHMKDGAAVSSALREEFRIYDTTRPYTVGVNDCVSSMKNGFVESMDVMGFNYRPFFYGEFREKYPERPYYGSETCSCVGTRDTYFFPMGWRVGDGSRMFMVSAYGLYAPHWGCAPDAEWAAHSRNPDVAGEYVWTGFDYLGEPTPYNQDQSNAANFGGMSEAEKKAAMEMMAKMGNKAPSRSSYFGIIDLAGFPKDTYYLYQSKWRPELPQAHILPHWNWQGREGQVTPVIVFSSGDEAELFLNGKSLGVRRLGENPQDTFTQRQVKLPKSSYRFVWDDVKYQPGKLEVVVKKDGKVWAKATRETTGPVAEVKAEVDRATILGDARDLAHISLSLVDEKGNVVPTDDKKVSFSCSGPAELVGFCNGDQTDQRCMQAPDQKFFRGRILAIVRAKRGQDGTATVHVRAEGMPEITIPVTVQKATPEQLKK